eukprot:350242-Chlamydomonas_euryale.AAC.18
MHAHACPCPPPHLQHVLVVGRDDRLHGRGALWCGVQDAAHDGPIERVQHVYFALHSDQQIFAVVAELDIGEQ